MTEPLGLGAGVRPDWREGPPCQCHRLRRVGIDPPWWPRLPEGKTWGDWCECMCPVHEREGPTDD